MSGMEFRGGVGSGAGKMMMRMMTIPTTWWQNGS